MRRLTCWWQNIVGKLRIVDSSVTYREVPGLQNDSSPYGKSRDLQSLAGDSLSMLNLSKATRYSSLSLKDVVGLCAGMRELADGNFSVVLPGLGRGDEVGDMALAVETLNVKAEQKARAEV